MTSNRQHEPSRRQPYAAALGIVALIHDEAIGIQIADHRLPGSVAAPTGPADTLIVDTRIAVSNPQMETALAALAPEPLSHPVKAYWHWPNKLGPRSLHMKTCGRSKPSALSNQTLHPGIDLPLLTRLVHGGA